MVAPRCTLQVWTLVARLGAGFGVAAFDSLPYRDEILVLLSMAFFLAAFDRRVLGARWGRSPVGGFLAGGILLWLLWLSAANNIWTSPLIRLADVVLFVAGLACLANPRLLRAAAARTAWILTFGLAVLVLWWSPTGDLTPLVKSDTLRVLLTGQLVLLPALAGNESGRWNFWLAMAWSLVLVLAAGYTDLFLLFGIVVVGLGLWASVRRPFSPGDMILIALAISVSLSLFGGFFASLQLDAYRPLGGTLDSGGEQVLALWNEHGGLFALGRGIGWWPIAVFYALFVARILSWCRRPSVADGWACATLFLVGLGAIFLDLTNAHGILGAEPWQLCGGLLIGPSRSVPLSRESLRTEPLRRSLWRAVVWTCGRLNGEAPRLAVVMGSSLVLAWCLQVTLGSGLNGGLLPFCLLAAAVAISPSHMRARWQSLHGASRVTMIALGVFFGLAEVVHWPGWHLLRDDVTLLSVFALVLSSTRPDLLSAAIRRFGVFFGAGFFVFLALMPGLGIYEKDRFGGFAHPNVTSLIAVFVGIVFLWTYQGRRWSQVVWVGVMWLVIAVCQSRTAMALCLANIGLYVVSQTTFWRRRTTHWSVAVVGVVLTCALYQGVGADVWKHFLFRDAPIERILSLGGRIVIWPTYLRLAFIDPIFGLGDSGLYGAIVKDVRVLEFNHAHNGFLHIAATRGLPTLAAVVILIGIALVRGGVWAKRVTAPFSGHVVAAIAIVATGAVYSMVEPVAVACNNVASLMFWCALFHCLIGGGSTTTDSPRARSTEYSYRSYTAQIPDHSRAV